MADLRLVVLSGSLRAASANTLVAETLISHSPSSVIGARFDLRPVPFFDQDVEDIHDPAAVTALKTAVQEADGLVLVTPEYNAGVPALVKNAVDWLSRPYGSGSLVGKPVGLISAGPGSRGGSGVREHLSSSLSVLTERRFEETLGLGSIYSKLEDGALTQEALDELLAWYDRFCAFARSAPD